MSIKTPSKSNDYYNGFEAGYRGKRYQKTDNLDFNDGYKDGVAKKIQLTPSKIQRNMQSLYITKELNEHTNTLFCILWCGIPNKSPDKPFYWSPNFICYLDHKLFPNLPLNTVVLLYKPSFWHRIKFWWNSVRKYSS